MRKGVKMDLAIKENRGVVPAVQDNLFFDVERFEFAQRVATMFSKSTMVPDHFQNNIGNCMIGLNYAARIRADPFMTMQQMYIIHGRPAIQGVLVISLVNQCGRFEPLEFDQDKTGCTAFAKEIKSGKILRGTRITMDMVRAEGWLDKKGSKWKTMPEQMFRYRAAAFFARAFCPEVMLGMETREEVLDITDMARSENGTYQVSETEARIKGEVGGPGSGELVDAEFDAMDGAANEPTGRVFGAANRPEPKMVECQYCGNEYTAGSGLTRHENVCPHKKIEKTHEAEIEESDPTPFPNVDPALFDSHSFKNLKILLQSEKSKAVWDRVFAHKEITEEDQITKAIGYIQKQVQRETISTVGER